jgi:hypothetical protein
MSMESYREGYEAGRNDSFGGRVIASMLDIVRDDDYNKGYSDGAAGRDFDYYGQGED